MSSVKIVSVVSKKKGEYNLSISKPSEPQVTGEMETISLQEISDVEKGTASVTSKPNNSTNPAPARPRPNNKTVKEPPICLKNLKEKFNWLSAILCIIILLLTAIIIWMAALSKSAELLATKSNSIRRDEEQHPERKAELPTGFSIHSEAETTTVSATTDEDDSSINIDPLVKNSSVLHSPPENEPEEVCKTPECLHLAERIGSIMDPDVKPCENFYRFSCGRMLMNPIMTKPEDDDFLTRMYRILDDDQQTSEWHTLTVMKELYDQCRNDKANDKERMDHFIWTVNQVGRFNHLDSDLTSLLIWTLQLGYNPLFDVRLDVDKEDTSRFIFQVVPTFLDHQSIKPIIDTVLSAFPEDVNQVEKEIISTTVDELIMSNEEESHNFIHPSNNFELMNVSTMNSKFPGIDWITLFKNFSTSMEIYPEESVQVYLPAHLDKLIQLVNKVKNDQVWNAILALYASQLYKAMVIMDPAKRSNEACLSASINFMPDAAYAIYMSTFDAEEEAEMRAAFEKIFGFLRLTLQDFMGGTQKDNILAMNLNMLDDGLHLARNQQELDYRWRNFKLGKNYSESYLSLVKHHREVMYELKSLNPSMDNETIWSFFKNPPSSFDHAQAIRELNMVLVPLGMALQRKGVDQYYNNKHPAYWNMGKIGFLMAHEMMHFFDQTGASNLHGASLISSEWNATMERIHRQITTAYEHETGITLSDSDVYWLDNEFYADEEGLHLAWETYVHQLSRQDQGSLPLLNLTDAQLFFLSVTQMQCHRKDDKTRIFLTPNLRVNMMMANNEEFKQAYSCSSSTDAAGDGVNWLAGIKQTLSEDNNSTVVDEEPPNAIEEEMSTEESTTLESTSTSSTEISKASSTNDDYDYDGGSAVEKDKTSTVAHHTTVKEAVDSAEYADLDEKDTDVLDPTDHSSGDGDANYYDNVAKP